MPCIEKAHEEAHPIMMSGEKKATVGGAEAIVRGLRVA